MHGRDIDINIKLTLRMVIQRLEQVGIMVDLQNTLRLEIIDTLKVHDDRRTLIRENNLFKKRKID
jgi:hypothetical protein